jgi:hypothetical protein
MNADISEESWVSYLGFVQNVITRMAQNSYLLKGWTVTLVAAIFALSLSLDSTFIITIALLPTIVFSVLDAYYLRQERLFRKLYDDVRRNPQGVEAFSMNTSSYQVDDIVGIMKTVSIWPFYSAIGVAAFLAIQVSALLGNCT